MKHILIFYGFVFLFISPSCIMIEVLDVLSVCIAVLDNGKVKHYKIRKLDSGGYFVSKARSFFTLRDLVEHYSRKEDGLCVCLAEPCKKVCNIFCFLFCFILSILFCSKNVRQCWNYRKIFDSRIQQLTDSTELYKIWSNIQSNTYFLVCFSQWLQRHMVYLTTLWISGRSHVPL